MKTKKTGGKPSLKRWLCPSCNVGKLAPSKPRKNDTRRYCLPCSEKTGRLVERACPALDKKREAATSARDERQTKAKAAKQAREESRWAVKGEDLRVAWDKMRRLKAIRDALRGRSKEWQIHKAEKHLDIRMSKAKPYTTGRAWARRRPCGHVVLTVGTHPSADLILACLLHEMCHLAAYPKNHDHHRTPQNKWGPHGEHFNGIFTRATKDLWDIDLEGAWAGYARTWDLERKLLARKNVEIPFFIKDMWQRPHSAANEGDLDQPRGGGKVTTTERSLSERFKF
jgi:hypothetical protein